MPEGPKNPDNLGLAPPKKTYNERKRKHSHLRRSMAAKTSSVDNVGDEKVPKSFVFSRGKLTGSVKQLKLDLRKLMLPHTALKLKEKRSNNLKDFLSISGPLGVSHFLILSKGGVSPYLRIARAPRGPTFTFKIHEYSLVSDIAKSQTNPRCPQELFKNSPLIVLSGFGKGDQRLDRMTALFSEIFPNIDPKTVKLSSCQRVVIMNYYKETGLIEFRHYSIRLQPVGVTRRLRKFVQNREIPDLSNLADVSEFVTRAGYGSESEADEENSMVNLASDLNRVNHASTKSAVKLQEIGPRMTLQLTKIEEGLCSGDVTIVESGKAEAKDQKPED